MVTGDGFDSFKHLALGVVKLKLLACFKDKGVCWYVFWFVLGSWVSEVVVTKPQGARTETLGTLERKRQRS